LAGRRRYYLHYNDSHNYIIDIDHEIVYLDINDANIYRDEVHLFDRYYYDHCPLWNLDCPCKSISIWLYEHWRGRLGDSRSYRFDSVLSN